MNSAGQVEINEIAKIFVDSQKKEKEEKCSIV